MPTYTFFCNNCSKEFELFFYIKDYTDKPRCSICQNKDTHRLYVRDVLTQNMSIKKADSELKTIGDLAQRNSERMSEDQKNTLYQKHNSYKDHKEETRPLPQGMNRPTKNPKIKWPGSSGLKKKRKPNK